MTEMPDELGSVDAVCLGTHLSPAQQVQASDQHCPNAVVQLDVARVWMGVQAGSRGTQSPPGLHISQVPAWQLCSSVLHESGWVLVDPPRK